jgi:hypothetical protein
VQHDIGNFHQTGALCALLLWSFSSFQKDSVLYGGSGQVKSKVSGNRVGIQSAEIVYREGKSNP